VSLLDSLLGRDKPVKSKTDALFALSTVEPTLETELDMKPTKKGAVSFRPVSSGDWSELESEMAALLDESTKDSPLKWKWFTDDFGFKWVILDAAEFENLVATLNMIGDELGSRGFGDQLLASLVQLTDGQAQSAYLIYNYKRGTFYPFVPNPSRDHDRLTAIEFRMSGTLAKEMPIEKEIDAWYPLWGVPL
jgi:hypothetical protein